MLNPDWCTLGTGCSGWGLWASHSHPHQVPHQGYDNPGFMLILLGCDAIQGIIEVQSFTPDLMPCICFPANPKFVICDEMMSLIREYGVYTWLKILNDDMLWSWAVLLYWVHACLVNMPAHLPDLLELITQLLIVITNCATLYCVCAPVTRIAKRMFKELSKW